MRTEARHKDFWGVEESESQCIRFDEAGLKYLSAAV